MNNIHSLMATVDGKHTAFTLQDHMDFAEKFIAYTGLSKSKTLTINQENIQSLTIAINNTDYYFLLAISGIRQICPFSAHK